MRNMKADLETRLHEVARERLALQGRLQHLDGVEQALKLLITEEEIQTKERQLALLPVQSLNGRPTIGRTPLSRFIVEALGDRTARPLKTLEAMAKAKGLDFGGKNAARSLHFVLVGLQKNGYARMVSPSVWQLTDKALGRPDLKNIAASEQPGIEANNAAVAGH